jgi:D-alanyl-D-alanine carboxypeptidase/D-alanyl-D-alanine-endopeptidase (penicillin-binding protein 4)
VIPRPISRAFLDAGVPLNAVTIAVQEVGAPRPLFALDPDRPMLAASVMKLVTTFAALELLGRDYRWKTEAYLGGTLDKGTLNGDLILKGHGDPKITIEQWQAFMNALHAKGLSTITGDLVLDRSEFRLTPRDVAVFDDEPSKPYNVAPDALLVNFKSVRFVFAPNFNHDGVDVRAEPPLPQIAFGSAPHLSEGGCGDWRAAIRAAFVDHGANARATFAGAIRRVARSGIGTWRYSIRKVTFTACSPPIFARPVGICRWRARGPRTRRRRTFAVLESPPLYDIVRDVNKLSNNVMARQVFLTLATTAHPPGVTTAQAAETIDQWLARRRLRMPGLVLENGSGLSRRERVSAGSLARLLAAADASRCARNSRALWRSRQSTALSSGGSATALWPDRPC